MTYKQAQGFILRCLISRGWTLSTSTSNLEIIWAVKTLGDGRVLTLWFKPQSIYFTLNNQLVRNFKNARSMHICPKDVATANDPEGMLIVRAMVSS